MNQPQLALKKYSVTDFVANDKKIPCLTDETEKTLWISGNEICQLFGLRHGRAAIQRHVSPENQKKLETLTEQPIPGLQKNRIFINFAGLREFLKKKNQVLLLEKLKRPEDVFLHFGFMAQETEPVQETLKTPLAETSSTEEEKTPSSFRFSSLDEIPEVHSGFLPSHGYVYLLRWQSPEDQQIYGKVGKTKMITTRKQQLSKEFKTSEMIWFCECSNMDILEREILEKLSHLGSLLQHPDSQELFDPERTSFEEVQQELERLCRRINKYYENHARDDYTNLGTATVNLLTKLTEKDLLTSTHISDTLLILKEIYQGFDEL